MNPIFIKRWDLHTILKKISNAYSEFHKAIEVDQNNKDALHGLALVHMEFQEYEMARDLFLRTLSIDPNYADAWFNLGICYQKLNNHKEAIDAFNKALSNPVFVTQDKAYFGKGLSFYRLGQYEDAKQSFDKAIKRNFLLIPAHLYMALTYQNLMHIQKQPKQLHNTIKVDPSLKGDTSKIYKKSRSCSQNR